MLVLHWYINKQKMATHDSTVKYKAISGRLNEHFGFRFLTELFNGSNTWLIYHTCNMTQSSIRNRVAMGTIIFYYSSTHDFFLIIDFYGSVMKLELY